jgi:hypothetical protein
VATPIFVLGKHRSGTTGLANHLCEHSAAAGVQYKQHFDWGYHESGYFTYVAGRYGPLSYWPNYREFVEVICASDYFRLTEIEKEYMLSLWPTTYVGFFESVMDEYARRQNSRYWLEKSPSHTKKALWLAEEYPEARFVAIIRDIADVVASSLSHNGGGDEEEPGGVKRLAIISRVVLVWVYYKKLIYELQNQYPSRTTIVAYQNFREKKASVLKDICTFLKIDPEEDIYTLPYSRNSSFSDGKTRDKAITETERAYSRQLAAVLNKVPYEGYRLLYFLYEQFREQRDLPTWFFRILDKKEKKGHRQRMSRAEARSESCGLTNLNGQVILPEGWVKKKVSSGRPGYFT